MPGVVDMEEAPGKSFPSLLHPLGKRAVPGVSSPVLNYSSCRHINYISDSAEALVLALNVI